MKMLSVAWKDIQILLKDRGTLVLSFLLPLVFILPGLDQLGEFGLGFNDGVMVRHKRSPESRCAAFAVQ